MMAIGDQASGDHGDHDQRRRRSRTLAVTGVIMLVASVIVTFTSTPPVSAQSCSTYLGSQAFTIGPGDIPGTTASANWNDTFAAGPVYYYVHNSFTPAQVASVDAAVAKWNNATANINLQPGGLVATLPDGSATSNVIGPDTGAPIGGYAGIGGFSLTYSSVTSAFTFDVRVNMAVSVADFDAVVLHELGHALGLDHIFSPPGQVMGSAYTAGSAPSTLGSQDLVCIQNLYNQVAAPTLTPTVPATLVPTATATLVPTSTPTATLVPTSTPTATLVPTSTPTATLVPTSTPTATATLVPPTATATIVPPTATATGVPTATAVTPPAATATATVAAVVPTSTPTVAPPVPATVTPTTTAAAPTATPTAVAPTATATIVPPTATAVVSTPTAVPPTATVPATATVTVSIPTSTPTPTATAAAPTATSTLVPVATSTPTATAVAPTATSTPTVAPSPTPTMTPTATATSAAVTSTPTPTATATATSQGGTGTAGITVRAAATPTPVATQLTGAVGTAGPLNALTDRGEAGDGSLGLPPELLAFVEGDAALAFTGGDTAPLTAAGITLAAIGVCFLVAAGMVRRNEQDQ